jgi:cytoskeletal protein RodZ
MNENMETTTPTTQAPKKGNGLVWIIVVIVFIAALAGGYFVGQQFANKEDEKETETSKKDKKKSSKEDDDEDEDEEEEKSSKKSKKNKDKDEDEDDDDTPAVGTKTIVCAGDYEGMGSISVNFEYSNSKKTITSGNMSMTLDLASLDSDGTLSSMTDAQIEQAFKEFDFCASFEDDEMYSSCEASVTNKKMNVKLGFDVDEMLSELTDTEKQVDANQLASEIQSGLRSQDFDVTCTVK